MSNQKPDNSLSNAKLSLKLSKIKAGVKPVIDNAECIFNYTWDFQTGTGSAQLTSIDKCDIEILLYPIGLAGKLAFMSDMKPTTYVVNGQRAIIYRVMLSINLVDNAASAAVMFNEDGSCLERTPNFDMEAYV